MVKTESKLINSKVPLIKGQIIKENDNKKTIVKNVIQIKEDPTIYWDRLTIL